MRRIHIVQHSYQVCLLNMCLGTQRHPKDRKDHDPKQNHRAQWPKPALEPPILRAHPIQTSSNHHSNQQQKHCRQPNCYYLSLLVLDCIATVANRINYCQRGVNNTVILLGTSEHNNRALWVGKLSRHQQDNIVSYPQQNLQVSNNNIAKVQ